MGLQNFVGNLAGILAPIVTGWIVDRTGSFVGAFAVAAAICVLGMAIWGLVVRRIEAIRWSAT